MTQNFNDLRNYKMIPEYLNPTEWEKVIIRANYYFIAFEIISNVMK